jgi:hypothetical protein
VRVLRSVLAIAVSAGYWLLGGLVPRFAFRARLIRSMFYVLYVLDYSFLRVKSYRAVPEMISLRKCAY